MKAQKNISLLFLLLLLPVSASAATVSLRATPPIIGKNDTVQVTVLLDSAIAANAFSGTLTYPADSLEPLAISDGNSIVSMWVTRPTISNTSAVVVFAGITPGGFSGDDGILFSIVFRAKAAGTAEVSLLNVEVLRNDGAGGNEPTTVEPLTLSVTTGSSGGYVEPSDDTPPEAFSAYLSTDTQLSDGKNYVVFSTVDKGSGLDHYTVAESRVPSFLWPLLPPSWYVTVSPYVLSNQNLTSTIYIKAVDRAGNERLSVFPPQHLFTTYEMLVFLAILMGAVLLWQYRLGRRLKSNL
ncbi:hypothetical protein EXS57_03105 [Candidatus Kaiserbacteria bacterium]|nr:hypothetical protein [Candidatus Kaiserbacteria bacterium]